MARSHGASTRVANSGTGASGHGWAPLDVPEPIGPRAYATLGCTSWTSSNSLLVDRSGSQIIDTITTRRASRREGPLPPQVQGWDPQTHPGCWRAIWAYSTKRAVRDNHTLIQQHNRAVEIIDGTKAPKKTRFLKTGPAQGFTFDEVAFQQAQNLIGLKGYVTNIPPKTMPAQEVISCYHDLWHVEQSFRMSKTDLAARPIFHRKRDAIEAHLTIVFAALAIARDLQERAGTSIKKIIHTLRPLRHVTIQIADQHLEAEPTITDDISQLLHALGH